MGGVYNSVSFVFWGMVLVYDVRVAESLGRCW